MDDGIRLLRSCYYYRYLRRRSDLPRRRLRRLHRLRRRARRRARLPFSDSACCCARGVTQNRRYPIYLTSNRVGRSKQPRAHTDGEETIHEITPPQDQSESRLRRSSITPPTGKVRITPPMGKPESRLRRTSPNHASDEEV